MARSTPLTTSSLGFPRMGKDRELKFALEAFWKGKSSEAELQAVAGRLRREHWLLQKSAGIDIVPSNDFSLYDQVLDALVLIGATPERFGNRAVSLAEYFAMARNSNEQTAMEMTKWFDTNYHYLVPEWSAGLPFELDTTKLLGEIRGGARARHQHAPGADRAGHAVAARQAATSGCDVTLLLPRMLARIREGPASAWREQAWTRGADR